MSSRRPRPAGSDESDSSVERPRRRRLRLEEMTDDESDVGSGPGRRRCLPLESEDDDAGPSGSGGESSDGDSDKCPICLLRLAGQEIGTPDACDHAFCSDCLIEWSNHVNTCPVDRKEFSSVLVRARVGGKALKTIPVKPRRTSLDELVEEQPTICQICHSAEFEETMLLCDTCDLGYHMECLNPPLDEVPLEDWHCPACSDRRPGPPEGRPRIAVGPSAAAAETRPAGGRSAAAPPDGARDDAALPSTSTRGAPAPRSRSAAAGPSRKTKTRRKRRTARRVVVEYEILDGEKFPSKRKYVARRRRRKAKRRVPKTAARRKQVRSSVKGRLAELLRSSCGGAPIPSLSGIVAPQFTLFGNPNELDVVSDDETGGDVPSGAGPAVAAVPRFRISALLEARRQNRRKLISIPSPAHASSAPDLLSSIMESQSLLLSKSTTLSVKEDGSIVMENSKTERSPSKIPRSEENVDVNKADPKEATKETPGYGNGGGRGGGSWRGNRNDYQGGGNQNRNSRPYQGGGGYQAGGHGNYWEGNNYGGENFNEQGNSYFNSNRSWPSNSGGREPREQYPAFADRPSHQRGNQNRGRGNQNRYSQMQQRQRSFPQWQQREYSDYNERQDTDYNEQQDPEEYHQGDAFNSSRLEEELEVNAINDNEAVADENIENSNLGVYEISNLSSTTLGNAPPQPPIIRFQKPVLSDDGNSDSESKADKYDPTEPTLGDSSSGDEATVSELTQNKFTIVSPPHFVEPDMSNICEESEPINFSALEMDQAAQQVLKKPDGCPNLSIYMSPNLANIKSKEDPEESKNLESDTMTLEDLVQEDDEDESSVPVDCPSIKSDEGKVPIECNSSLTLSSKFAPKRNVIKINLSSNLGIKKRLIGSESDKKDDCTTTAYGNPSMNSDSTLFTSQVNNYKSHDDELPINSSSQMQKDAESISDIDDERSYTPCLDENKSVKSKDTSIDGSEKENGGIEGLDTELISEDEGNEMFSDINHRSNFDIHAERRRRDPENPTADREEGEIIEKKKQKIKAIVKEMLEKPEEKISDDDKKRKRRDKKTDKDDNKEKSSKGKNKRDNDTSFKKLSKSGKERNYRERDDKSKKSRERRRSKSGDKENKDKKERRKDKRKDMERYDVRNIISDRSRRIKDAFGRDKSRPRSNTPDSRPSSPTRFRRSPSRKRSLSKRRSTSRNRNSMSRRSISKCLSKSPLRQPLARRSSITRNRTISKGLRSMSREKRSPSPRKSPSPKRRSVSPRPRSPVLRNRRSISPRARRSISPRVRRSVSPRIRRSRSPRARRSLSRNRNRRKRSVSRGLRGSPRILKPKSPPRRRLSRRSRSRARSLSRNRSRSPKLRKQHKSKRNKSNSRGKSPPRTKLKRKRSRSFSPTLALSRSLSRDRAHHQNWHEMEKSPLYQDWTSGSQSMSPCNRVSPGWTPPMEKSPEPRNLRVILTTKDKNKRKEKKKKTSKKNRMADRVLKHQLKESAPSKEVFTSGNNILVSLSFNKNSTEKVPIISSHETVTKKKKRKTETSTKSKKDKTKEKLKKKRIDKEKRTKELENKKPVAIIDLDKSPFKELTPSPKAVIVLSDSDTGDKEEIIEVQNVIIHDKILDAGPPQPEIESLPCSPHRDNDYPIPAGPKTPPEPSIKFTIMGKSNLQLRAVNPLHEEEEEDEINEDAEAAQNDDSQNKNLEVLHKGPNTPPDPPNSPPSSPDAYDPFEPTKSGSATPERVTTPPIQTEKENESKIDEIPEIPCISLEAAQKSNLLLEDVIQTKPISPTEKVLALLKSTRTSLSPGSTISQLFGEPSLEIPKVIEPEPVPAVLPGVLSSPDGVNLPNSLANKVSQAQITYSAIIKPSSPKPIYSTVAPTFITSTPIYLNPSVSRPNTYSIASSPSAPRVPLAMPPKVTLPSPSKSSPLKTQPKLFLSKPSPIKSTPIKPIVSKAAISKLPLPAIKPLPARTQKASKTPTKSGQNGSEMTVIDMDMDSPYSPGSSDFGDLFDPPSDNGKHANTVPAAYPSKSSHKINPFDALFSISSKSGNKNSNTAKVSIKPVKKTKGGKKIVGVKIDDDNLKILEELPSSAVEMQVKTKFLKKLNRQERVVDEVKLVLKPHYTKKHITKEEYKDILRRAVPKICHNRSGEINPTKIQALIEAYVKKFRKKAHLPK